MTAIIDPLANIEMSNENAAEPTPQLWHWTIERYQQAIDAGVLTKHDKVELLFGQLILKMPIGNVHAATIEKIPTRVPSVCAFYSAGNTTK